MLVAARHQGIGLFQVHHHGAESDRIAHLFLGVLSSDALAMAQVEVLVDEDLPSRRFCRVDDLDVFEMEIEVLDQFSDHPLAADEDGLGDKDNHANARVPDGGTARADFPGGDAATLYRSIQRILSLPEEFRVFVCHDYLPEGRELEYQTTVGEQRESNIHVHRGIGESAFTKMRTTRDATLGMPTLILPSLQVNMRAGHLPPPEDKGQVFLKLPINAFGGDDVSELKS